MATYKIYAGLNGGFGGANLVDTCECLSREEAENIAYEEACDIFYGYMGLYGIPDVSDIIDDYVEYGFDEEPSEDEAWEYIEEVRDSWVDYYVEEDEFYGEEIE